MKLGWYVQVRKLDVASVRFRCLHMAAALQGSGVESVILDDAASMLAALPELDAVILVKRMDTSIIDIASAAKDNRKAVLMDFCDDVLAAEYRANARELNRAVFRGVLPLLDAIVTTGPGMTARLREYGYSLPPVVEIPDVAETKQVVAETEAFARALHGPSHSAPAPQPAVDTRETKEALSEGERVLAKVTQRRTIPQKIFRAIRHPLWTADRLHQVLTARISVPDRKGPALMAERALRAGIGRTNSYLRSLFKRQGEAPEEMNAAAKPAKVRERKEKTDSRPRIVWFGNHGAPHSTFGMLSLLPVAESLKIAYARQPFVLELVSNNREKFDGFITHLGVPCVYTPWTLEGVYQAIDRATLALLTSGDDSFCDVKSANRALQALGCGKPVVSPPSISLAPLANFVIQGDVGDGIVRYLEAPHLRETHVVSARNVIARDYSFAAVAKSYLAILDKAIRSARRRPAIARVGAPTPRLLFLMDLAQDLAVVRPLLLEARAKGAEAMVLTTPRAGKKTPGLTDFLAREKIIPTMVTEEELGRGDARWLRAADIVVMAAESSLSAHRVAHALAGLARRHATPTVSLQHGLEVEGLTIRSDSDPVRFNSDIIFTWAAPDALPEWLDPDIRRRCMGLGRSWKVPGFQQNLGGSTIGVFENLHWDRYTREYRRAFVDDLLRVADQLKERTFVIHTHPAGLWFRKHGPQALPDNMLVATPKGEALQVLARSHCIITTPSTIALDAAQIGRPVAVTHYDLDTVDTYNPLQKLQGSDDWVRFITDPANPMARDAQQTFLNRVCRPGDATDSILTEIVSRVHAAEAVT
ncbi:MAG: hypothetical protein EON93_03535 [Burkholderiales bacterium]|nr:MAG: hypothetical protein EON93_03535 [Burkholderiales bacterium]